MNEDRGGGRAKCDSVENSKGFQKRGRDIRAIIGPKNDRRGGGVRGLKDNGVATRGVEDRAISVDMASPVSGGRGERLQEGVMVRGLVSGGGI